MAAIRSQRELSPLVLLNAAFAEAAITKRPDYSRVILRSANKKPG
jgi:hypothetical protein